MTLPLEAERLLIREYVPADVDDVARMIADPALALGDDEPLTYERSRAWLDGEIGYARRDGTGRYALVLRATGEVVGGSGPAQRGLEAGVEVELGSRLRRDLWGRGLATEAALGCAEDACERGLPRLIAFIEP